MRPVLLTLCLLFVIIGVSAQTDGSIHGIIKDSSSGEPLRSITVSCIEAKKVVASLFDGSFQFTNLSSGTYTIKVTGIGWTSVTKKIEVQGSQQAKIEFSLVQSAQNIGEIIVYAASRQPEKLTTAPAAISVVAPLTIEQNTSHGSVGKTMEHLVGVDVVQSGSNDFNINARGFNNSINRRMLVLIDGRDPSTPLINLNEWNSLS